MRRPTDIGRFTVHLSAAAWSAVGLLPGEHFSSVREALERIAEQLGAGFRPPGDRVELTVGGRRILCRVESAARRVIVESIELA